MNAGQNTKMLRGAIWACVIPVGLGLIGLGFTIFDLMFYEQKKFIVRTHHFFTRPVVLSFILGTPLAAWIACRHLRTINSAEKLSRWRRSPFEGLVGATLAHFGAVCLYVICVWLFVDLTGGGYDMSQRDVGVLEIGFKMLTFNTVLWLFITLPLSLICATIFWRVTKFPDDPTVRQADL